nr:hypothetical protein [Pandoravirus massiliensis]
MQSPARPGDDHVASGDQLHALYECAMGLRQVKTRPTVRSIEAAWAKAARTRRRRPTNSSPVQSCADAREDAVARSSAGNANNGPSDNACATTTDKPSHYETITAAERLESQPSHADRVLTSSANTPNGSSPPARREDGGRDPTGKQKDCAYNAHQRHRIQADTLPTPKACRLPIHPPGVGGRRTRRAITLLALVTLWIALACMAYVFACHARRVRYLFVFPE